MTCCDARLFLLILASLVAGLMPATADELEARSAEVLKDLSWPGALRLPIGVSERGAIIWALIDREALLPRDGLRRVVVVSGLDGNPATVEALRSQRQSPLLGQEAAGRFTRIWIPIANPDAWWDCLQMGEASRPLDFPPRGSAYNTAGEVESAVVWRFLEWIAADAVIEVTKADDSDYVESLEKKVVVRKQRGLARAVRDQDQTGRLEMRAAWLPANLLGSDPSSLDVTTRAFAELDPVLAEDAPASRTAQAAVERLQRAPLDLAERLLGHYGEKLSTVMYQPALALMARMEFGELTGNPSQREAVGRVLEPYLSGQQPALTSKSGGSHFAGHLVFAEWARATGDPRAIELVRAAADRAFDDRGRPRDAMPTHNEMSDAVFMACPILVAAGRLTGEAKYLDMAGRHLTFMQKHCLRDDGIYRHSPLCEAAWGRGNGFPALGLALSLTDLQALLDGTTAGAAGESVALQDLQRAARRLYDQMLPEYRQHMLALRAHQDPTGAWRQVIDHPGAYRELTATCMITFALARGLRQGWIDPESFRPSVDRAWQAIQIRVYDDGGLIDVCTGTGKQKSLQDYFQREAILGKDERGGAMSLIAAIEMARLLADSPVP